MAAFEVGDKVQMPGVPIVVTVLGLGTCGDEGCDRQTFSFDDPGGLGTDSAHCDEFEKVPA